jgi:hypothetical protein
VAALAVLLVALLPLMRMGSAFTSDEGAYALQVEALAQGSWAYEYRAAPLDPEGRAFPVILSDRGPGGFYPYVKHPAVPLLLLAGTKVLGTTLGLHLLSLLGVIGAAAAAWVLAGALDPRLRRPAFWLAAGGPTLVNGFALWAHAPAAALAGLALVGAATIARRGITPGPAAGMTAALVGGVLLRSEGLLFAGALAVALAAVRLARTRRFTSTVATFLLTAGPAVAAAVLERRWISSIVGGSYGEVAGQGSNGASFLAGRRSGAWHVLLQGHFVDPRAALPVLLALALVVGLGFPALRRWGPRSTRTLAVVAALTAVLLGARIATHSYDPVTGLLPAAPLLVLGVLLFRWRGAGPVAGLLAGTAAIFAAGILATQYPQGGGLEWGGRYLSAALVPLAVLAAGGLVGAVARAPRPGQQRAAALLVGIGLAVSGFSLVTSGALRAREDAIVSALARHPAPVTVTTRPALPRLAWRAGDRLTWMLTGDGGLPALLHGLRARGIGEVAVVVGRDVPLTALSAYPTLEEQDEPALRDSGIRLIVARA